MIIVIFIVIFTMLMVGGGIAAYFLTKDDEGSGGIKETEDEGGSGDGSGGDESGDGASSTKTSEMDVKTGEEEKDDGGNSVTNTGGLDSSAVAALNKPQAPGAYKPIGDSPVCDPKLCTGTKVLKSKDKKGTTVNQCCRDKSCVADWNPEYGGNPEQCRRDGMVFDDQAPDMGKTNKECCKFDTTSYARWCVQDKAYKANGSAVKTNSPMPLSGVLEHGVGNHPNNAAAVKKKFIKWVNNDGTTKESLLSHCKKECDKVSDCSAFYLRGQERCALFRPAGASDLKYGIEKSNINVTDTNLADFAYEFYLKSTYVPENKRKMTINGKVKIAGVDEDYCPFDYTSFYGWGNWDRDKHSGMHPRAKYGGNVKCYGPGGTHHGVKLMNYNNTVVPMISSCAHLCDKVGKCGGFWVYGVKEAHRYNSIAKGAAGKCCLKYDLDPKDKEQMSFVRPNNHGDKAPGGYFIKVKNGVMGPRPWRKSYIKAVN